MQFRCFRCSKKAGEARNCFQGEFSSILILSTTHEAYFSALLFCVIIVYNLLVQSLYVGGLLTNALEEALRMILMLSLG